MNPAEPPSKGHGRATTSLAGERTPAGHNDGRSAGRKSGGDIAVEAGLRLRRGTPTLSWRDARTLAEEPRPVPIGPHARLTLGDKAVAEGVRLRHLALVDDRWHVLVADDRELVNDLLELA